MNMRKYKIPTVIELEALLRYKGIKFGTRSSGICIMKSMDRKHTLIYVTIVPNLLIKVKKILENEGYKADWIKGKDCGNTFDKRYLTITRS